MPDFKARLSGHVEHVKVHGHLCSTEETTKQALTNGLETNLGILIMKNWQISAMTAFNRID
jgi:hypothetical protein